MDHGFSTCLPYSSFSSSFFFFSFSSSSSSYFGRIGFDICREADMRKASRLRSLSTRPPGVERPVVHVDPATGKVDGPQRKKLRTHLGIVARDKVDITYENWKEVPTAQKDLIWEDIQAEFDIPEASNNLTRKWALAADQDGVEDTVCDKYGISKEKWAQFCQTRRDPSWEDVRIKAQAIQK
ncbi:hypothetical protein HKD37_20G056096 [Glycine soja]